MPFVLGAPIQKMHIADHHAHQAHRLVFGYGLIEGSGKGGAVETTLIQKRAAIARAVLGDGIADHMRQRRIGQRGGIPKQHKNRQFRAIGKQMRR